jgi:flagellar hook-associated protein 3 FlgL
MARIAPGTSVRTNLPGDIVFGNSLAALEQLRVDLVGGAPVAGTTIILLDAGMNEVLDSRAILGSRQNRIAMTMVSLDDNVFASRKLLSDLEDVDLTVAISELTLRQTTYEAALQVSARILQTSLINQLR